MSLLRYNSNNTKRLTKEQLEEIINSDLSLPILSAKFDRSEADIVKIKEGKLYGFYNLHKEVNFIKKESNKILKTLETYESNKNFHSSYYYYNANTKDLSVSFRNFLFIVNLKTKKTTLTFNEEIRGDSITYEKFEELILQYNIIL